MNQNFGHKHENMIFNIKISSINKYVYFLILAARWM